MSITEQIKKALEEDSLLRIDRTGSWLRWQQGEIERLQNELEWQKRVSDANHQDEARFKELQDELEQVKKELADCKENISAFESLWLTIKSELEERDRALQEARSIIDSIALVGSKTGRPDYGTMVTADVLYKLSKILNRFNNGGKKDSDDEQCFGLI